MSVIVQPVPILADNYAWLLRETATGAVAIVDPADAHAVSTAIDGAGGRLDLILLTHHHADHTAGTDAVRRRYGCKVVGAAADAPRLPELDIAVAEGDQVAFGAASATVIATPCHTSGHISYYLPAGPVLLCGDTLFSLGCGRFFEGTAADMFTSLAKFALLPDDTLVCGGHEYTEGNARFALSVDPENAALRARAAEISRLRLEGRPTLPSRLGTERAANPFLRARDPERLAWLRSAKDHF